MSQECDGIVNGIINELYFNLHFIRFMRCIRYITQFIPSNIKFYVGTYKVSKF